MALLGFVCAPASTPGTDPGAQTPVHVHEPCWICLGSRINRFGDNEPCAYCNARGYIVREAA